MNRFHLANSARAPALAIAVWLGLALPVAAGANRGLDLGADRDALARLVRARGVPFAPVGEASLRHAVAFLDGRDGERRLRAVIDLATATVLEVSEREASGGRRSTVYRHRVTAVGHRGAGLLAPENTPAAIDAGIRIGVDLLELDLRATRDGVPVLFHDATLDRTTAGSGAISERTLAELAELEAGSWFDSAFAGEPIPTLEAALERIGEHAAIDVDFKAGDPQPVIELLRRHRQLARATFHSGSPAVLDQVRAHAPQLRIRPTLRDGVAGLAALIERYDPAIVNINWHVFSPELVRAVHRAGRLAFVNTLGPGDGRERIRRALAAGADFVQSDHLELLVPLVHSVRTVRHAGWGKLDAHNAYPYHHRFRDRLVRARGSGALAIEQDLCWWVDEQGHGHSLVSHGEPFSGDEPRLEAFFTAIEEDVEEELRSGDPRRWPVIVLNLDLKRQGDHPRHHAALFELLRRYENWLTVAERTSSLDEVAPLLPGPVLVLAGGSAPLRASFHDAVPPGERLLLFGAAGTRDTDPQGRPLPAAADNYHRWWNLPWRAVEPEGQTAAGPWTAADAARLESLVDRAHRAGLWIRFYTLNGAGEEASDRNGWSPGYDFGSLDAVTERWRSALSSGVDFIATDQYEAFGALAAELQVSR